jgi:hypothetical protein
MADLNNPSIGILTESSLHAALKGHYAQDGDAIEQEIDGYLIDIVAANELIEIQTKNFGHMKTKLRHLLDEHIVRVVYPIIRHKTIVRISAEGELINKRKSPKRGRAEDVFAELIRIPDASSHANFRLTTALVDAEEYWIDDGNGSWRRKFWSIADRKVTRVVEEHHYSSPKAYLNILPASLERPFTNKDLKQALRLSPRLAGKITYTLEKVGLVTIIGKKGRANLFDVTI